MEPVPTDTFQGATASTLASQLGYRVHLAPLLESSQPQDCRDPSTVEWPRPENLMEPGSEERLPSVWASSGKTLQTNKNQRAPPILRRQNNWNDILLVKLSAL